MNFKLRLLIKRKLPSVLQHNDFLFGYDEDSHLHMQVVCNNIQSEQANGLHLLMSACQEQAKEFAHVLGTKVLPPKRYKTRKQNRALQRQPSYWFLASCLHSWLTQSTGLVGFKELRIISLLNLTAAGLLLLFPWTDKTSGRKCLLTVLALLLSDDLDLSKSGWQCHGEHVLHRKDGPITASEPKSYSRKRQNKTSDLT